MHQQVAGTSPKPSQIYPFFPPQFNPKPSRALVLSVTHFFPPQYNPKQSRVLGIFGLSLYTGEKDLRENLEKYGDIERIQVVYDHQVSGRFPLHSRCLKKDCLSLSRVAGLEVLPSCTSKR